MKHKLPVETSRGEEEKEPEGKRKRKRRGRGKGAGWEVGGRNDFDGDWGLMMDDGFLMMHDC